MTRAHFRLVELDLDGTLVDTRDDLVASTNHVRESFGMDPLPADEIVHLVGHGARALVERALGAANVGLHDEGVRRLLAHYGQHCLDRSRPYPGMVEVLDALRVEGVVFAVLTNKLEALARKVLDGLGLASRLAAVVGGDTFAERKPHSRGAEHIRRQVGCKPGEVVLVGDSRVDVETARAAGIACCGVLWGFDPEGLRAAAPDFLVANSDGLAGVIRGEGQR